MPLPPYTKTTVRLAFGSKRQTGKLDHLLFGVSIFCTSQMPPNRATLDDIFQTVSRAQVIIINRFDWLV
ncbi:hypothetical protein FXV75_15645 [Marinomonas sp. IMCC 4694]|nr:hypothetical protein FXV75_15645 [Marinomonas sp. IMCC 4694]